jgi:hypothetical protein
MSLSRTSIHNRLKGLRSAELYWRYGSNLGATVDHLFSSQNNLPPVTKKIINELRLNGIAAARVEDLLDPEVIAELDQATQQLLTTREKDIRYMKSNVDSPLSKGEKAFNLELLGSEPEFDADSIFAKVGVSSALTSIANNYLRMTAQLRYYNVWYTAASTGAFKASQLWHFDREDNYILKVFLYLDDVDEGTGPFTYAPGTHRQGRYRSITPEFVMEGNVRRTTDEQMAKVYPRERWKLGTGRKGSIIFADTRGYHKGGEARTRDRLMFTCMYTSPASQSRDLLRFPADIDLAKLSHEQIRVLRIPIK